MRSRSSTARRSSSRFACPRTMRWRASAGPELVATPASTSRAVIASSSRSISIRRTSISLLISASVRPRMRALRKFAASVSPEGGRPGGRSTSRFSIEPSSETSTTSARVGSRRTNSTCFSRGFCFVVTTTPAPRETPESSVEASASALSKVWPVAAARICASTRSRSSAVRSPISSMASTKKRRPISVGSRPALVCGA